jgi:hypothetical protein
VANSASQPLGYAIVQNANDGAKPQINYARFGKLLDFAQIAREGEKK